MKMNILLLGSGGREHALAWKLSQSELCTTLYIAPGNAGTRLHGTNVSLSVTDFGQIGDFVLERGVQMVIVGPEEPLVLGIYDYFVQDALLREVAVIGPSREGAQLEGSKAYAKVFMEEMGIPTAIYRRFDAQSKAEGVAYVGSMRPPIVLKADGLAAGKGVLILDDPKVAQMELSAMLEGKFGKASDTVVVENFLRGVEFSVFVLTDGKDYVLLPEAKDYKRVGEADTGLNTGGMGAVSPVPFATPVMMDKVRKRIIEPTLRGIEQRGIVYKGFIFFGLINVDGDPYVIEYNCRLGDPETEVVIPRLKGDLVELLWATHVGRLGGMDKPAFEEGAAATVMLVSGGYPGDYTKGYVMRGLEALGDAKDSLAFHAGTTLGEAGGGQVCTNGGRVLAVTVLAEDIATACRRATELAKLVQFEGCYFRSDIGKDLL